MNDDLRKMIAELVALLERAPSTEHQRLQNDLDAWAAARRFTQKVPELPEGSRPDVLRWRAATKDVFLGDAKVSANEDAGTTATLTRLDNYMEQFRQLLRSKTVTGGILAIATDSAKAAAEWVPALDFLARLNGLRGPGDSPPNFRVEQSAVNTWIVWW